jgi:RNA polymerase sigma-70 factor (ECF subfamily)
MPGPAASMRHQRRTRSRLMERKVQGEQEPATADLNALLLAVGRARDRAAFAALFEYFAPRLKAYLMRLGAGSGVAEDLAQEAMLIVWRKADQFDPGKAAASTWAFTIARNLRIDAIRREKRPAIDADDPALVPDDAPQADDHMARVQDDARVRDALTALPREQVEVVELSFFADKPHSVIASELGLPLGTVKSRLRLAMARLRAALGENP